MMNEQKVSVIVPAHEEESQISETLKSLLKQSFKKYEIIVVANGCTDKTATIARQFPKVRVYGTKKRGIGFACNYGAKKAIGDIFVFVEADTTLPKNTLSAIKKAIQNGAVGGTARMKPKENKVQYLLLCFLCYLDSGADWGPLRFCTRKVYEQIKGHREGNDFGVDGDFRRKVQQKGKTAYLSHIQYHTSMRRFEKLGFREMIRQNNQFLKAKLRGKPPTGNYPVIR